MMSHSKGCLGTVSCEAFVCRQKDSSVHPDGGDDLQEVGKEKD